jgi:hypothetical protein
MQTNPPTAHLFPHYQADASKCGIVIDVFELGAVAVPLLQCFSEGVASSN